MNTAELVSGLLKGNRQALARLITLVEEDDPETAYVMQAVRPHLGKAYCLGVTGMPGGGKSTLVDKLTALLRARGFSIGIVVVDPSSPFSGGALLGDRLRMQQHYLDEKVFIRSMATRGEHGGLPKATLGVVKLLDAFGNDFIILETAGVGQTELDIMKTADTIMVVLTPEAGDSIQTLKAGLLEIAHIFVVNKADRPGAETMVQNLVSVSCACPERAWWQPPVLLVQAVNNVGVEELWREIGKHRSALEESGRIVIRRREQRRDEFLKYVEEGIVEAVKKYLTGSPRLKDYLKKVECNDIDPFNAAQEILRDELFLKDWPR